MSQYGMTMPGGQMQRAASPNVYTGLLALATLALLAACVFVYIQGSRIAPAGGALKVHPFDANSNTWTVELPQK